VDKSVPFVVCAAPRRSTSSLVAMRLNQDSCWNGRVRQLEKFRGASGGSCATGALRLSNQWWLRSASQAHGLKGTGAFFWTVKRAAWIAVFVEAQVALKWSVNGARIWRRYCEGRRESASVKWGCSFVGWHLTTASSDHGGRVFGGPGRGSMMEINQLRFSSAQPASLKRER
jgi:hypothetical protein